MQERDVNQENKQIGRYSYLEALNQASDGITISNSVGDVEIWNKGMESLTGIPNFDAIGKPLWEVQSKLIPPEQLTPELLEQIRVSIDSVIKLPTAWQGEKREQEIICQDGTHKIVEDTSYAFKAPDGTTNIGVILRDITKQKQKEEELKQIGITNSMWKEIFENAKWGVVINTPGTANLGMMNPEFARMHGYTIEELQGRKMIQDVFAPEVRPSLPEEINKIHVTGHNTFESIHIRKDGSRFPVLVDGTAVKNLNRDVLYRIVNVQDISKRVRAEQEIEKHLAEKEVILKEVHHRIKNNMSVITSLLSLQSSKSNNIEFKNETKEAISRMRSMGLLYDKLYRSENLQELGMKEYLSPLVDEVIKNFPNNTIVKVEKHIDEFTLRPDKLQPFGILINELLTNIMKYAFNGRDSGIVSISASENNNHVTVVVADDGVGMPESINIGNESGFGLKLVDILTKQIDGTIRIERINGTKFTLEFDR